MIFLPKAALAAFALIGALNVNYSRVSQQPGLTTKVCMNATSRPRYVIEAKQYTPSEQEPDWHRVSLGFTAESTANKSLFEKCRFATVDPRENKDKNLDFYACSTDRKKVEALWKKYLEKRHEVLSQVELDRAIAALRQ